MDTNLIIKENLLKTSEVHGVIELLSGKNVPGKMSKLYTALKDLESELTLLVSHKKKIEYGESNTLFNMMDDLTEIVGELSAPLDKRAFEKMCDKFSDFALEVSNIWGRLRKKDTIRAVNFNPRPIAFYVERSKITIERSRVKFVLH